MDDFFKKDSPHGLLKRVIYKKYLQGYVAKILYSKLDVVVIDGFAGKGRYVSNWGKEIESYGSPLIILMVVLQFYCNYIDVKTSLKKKGTTWNKLHGAAIGRLNHQSNEEDEGEIRDAGSGDTRRTHIYLVESNPKYFKALKRNILMYMKAFFCSREHFNIFKIDGNFIIRVINPQFPFTIHLDRKTFGEFQPQFVANSMTLTILDPFGYSHTPMQHVQDFIDQTSEVLISFMSGYVNRFCQRHAGSVAELYGIETPRGNHDEFVRIVRENAEGRTSENPKSCTKSYIEHMKERTRSKYAQFYEMRGKNNSVIYHLIHFANHSKAFRAMKETFNTCSQYEGTFKMSDYKVLNQGVPLHLGNTQDEEELANTIFRKYCGKTVMLRQIEDYVTEHTLFVFRKKALKRLENGPIPKIIDVVDVGRSRKKRRKLTYPNWGNWKLAFRKRHDHVEPTA